MRKINLHLCLILVMAAGVLLYKSNKPFFGHHDWNSVVYSNIARNYLRYGYLLTKFGQVRNHDYASISEFNYLTHYPPLLPILISLSFQLFGITEIAARLVPISISVIMVALLYMIGREIYGEAVGLIAALLTILTPLYLYYGKLPVHDTVVPAFSLLAFWGYLHFNRIGKFRYYLLMVIGIILGGLLNWTGYYIVPAILLHQFIFTHKRHSRLPIIALVPMCIFLFSLHLLHIKILTGDFLGGGLSRIFMERANPYLTANVYHFSWRKYIGQEIQFLRIYFTNIVILAILFWFLKQIKQLRSDKRSHLDGYLIVLLIYGMIHLIIFPQLVFIHDYMIYYLLPFMVLAAASTIDKVIKLIPSWRFQSVVFTILILMMASERLSFTKALLDTDMNRKGVTVAKFINQKTKSGDQAFIGSLSYKEFYEVFIGFYADRRVGYGEQIMPAEITDYELIIRPKAHDALNEESKFLLNKLYQQNENEEFIWYLANSKKS